MPRKKPQRIEILPAIPAASRETALDQLAALVAEKLARNTALPQVQPQQSLAELSEEVLMEPWFLTKEIAYAILRLLPVSHQRKWSAFFDDYGCMKCGSKKVRHSSNGMCTRCHVRIMTRLKASFKQRAQENGPSAEEQVAKIVSRIANAERLLAGEQQHREPLIGGRVTRLLKPASDAEELSAQGLQPSKRGPRKLRDRKESK